MLLHSRIISSGKTKQSSAQRTKNDPYSLVLKNINGHAHVSGLLRARVQIPVVLGQQVDVVKNETVEVPHVQRLHEADVHQHRPVKGAVAVLLDYEDGVVQLLPPQEGVHVLEEEEQVFAPAPERDYDGHLLRHPAELRLPVPARFQPGEGVLQLLDCGDGGLPHGDSATWKS